MTLAVPRRRVRPEVRPGHALEILFYGFGTLLVAGIVHIGSVLLLPRHSEADAYARVRTLAHAVALQTVVGPPASAGFLPYSDPAMSTSYCLYDLADGPVRVSINVAESDFLALSMNARHGRAFYALTNRSASHGSVALTLMTADQIAAAEAQASDGDGLEDLRVLAPEPKGFVAVQALATAPSAMPSAEAEARKLLCRPGVRP